jgi:hypothetical protein
VDEKAERRCVLDGSRLGLREPFSYVHGDVGSVNLLSGSSLVSGSRGGQMPVKMNEVTRLNDSERGDKEVRRSRVLEIRLQGTHERLQKITLSHANAPLWVAPICFGMSC